MATTLNSSTFSQTTLSESDSLLVALFIAAIIHAFILLSINFTIPQPTRVNKQIEITLASAPTKKSPKNAKYLAQDNQVGAGQKTKKPTPPKQKIPSRGESKKKKPNKQKKQAISKPKAPKKVVVQQKAEYKIEATKKPAPAPKKKRPKLSTEALQRQIAQLGASIRHSQKSAEQTKIKFVNSVSTHKYLASNYISQWERKIEHIGNLNYPKVAREKGFSGTLTTDVGINADGSIYSIRITKSSGNKALDDAAKRIIRLSAPFAALPQALLKELDVLVITRVWKFTDESGITSP